MVTRNFEWMRKREDDEMSPVVHHVLVEDYSLATGPEMMMIRRIRTYHVYVFL